jgi:hypothetical protein
MIVGGSSSSMRAHTEHSVALMYCNDDKAMKFDDQFVVTQWYGSADTGSLKPQRMM